MPKEYVVKNCPIYKEDILCGSGKLCAEVTDCLIKQAIEKCKDCYEDCSDYSWAMGEKAKADEILQLFEIEEQQDER